MTWKIEHKWAHTCESSRWAGLLGSCALQAVVPHSTGHRVGHLRASVTEVAGIAVSRRGGQGVAITVLTQRAWQRGSAAGRTVRTWTQGGTKWCWQNTSGWKSVQITHSLWFWTEHAATAAVCHWMWFYAAVFTYTWLVCSMTRRQTEVCF